MAILMKTKCRTWRVQKRSFAIYPLSAQPNMGEPFKQLLMDLAIEAQQHAPRSAARSRALTQLIEAIHQSGRLSRLTRHTGRYPRSVFEDIYNEALQETYYYTCKKIDLYRPENPVMAWVNNTLNFKFIEVARQHPINRPGIIEPVPDPAIEDHILEYERLKDFLEADPKGLLASYWIRNHPEITFQRLIIARLQGTTWQALSVQTKIPLQALYAFFKRTLQKLLPYFHTYL
jgi:hypothetical protein